MQKMTVRLAVIAFMATMPGAAPCAAQEKLAKGEARQIAEEAYIYGFPLIMNYATMYEYAIDKSSPAHKAPINRLYNTARGTRPGTRPSSRPTATRCTRSSAWTCGPSRSC